MWFGYYPEIIFCHFFCNLNLVIFKCTIMVGDINSLNLLVFFRGTHFHYVTTQMQAVLTLSDNLLPLLPLNGNSMSNR